MTTMNSVSFLQVLLLLLGVACISLSGNCVQARGNLVRGAHGPKTLKHFSMHSRQLMEDKNKDKDDEDKEDEKEVEAAEEEDDKDQDDDEEEEETEAPEEPEDDVDESIVESIVEDPEAAVDAPANATDTQVGEEPSADGDATAPDANVTATEPVAPTEEFDVPLSPFSLTVDGVIDQDEMDLDVYLLNYMQTFMPNLVEVELDSKAVVNGEVVQDSEDSLDEPQEEEDINSTDTGSTRKLRVHAYYSAHRVLTLTTFYYEGNATFMGPPSRTAEEVDAALTYALSDAVALETHLQMSAPTANASITSVSPNDPIPTDGSVAGAQSEVKADDGTDEGLSTTGLSIVIVAACVGGISLFIILMVGLSGPSGSTAGIKGGLPEQPLQ